MKDQSRNLQELEGVDWGDPTHESSIVRRCHALRRVPVCELSPEDLRLLIGQQIGIEVLIPLALEMLENDPLTGGDYYQGDLLKSVLDVESGYWARHPREQA